MSLVKDEIEIDYRSALTKEAVRQTLESFVRSNSERLKNYQVVEFGGYFTPYPEDLFVHKRMHAGGGG